MTRIQPQPHTNAMFNTLCVYISKRFLYIGEQYDRIPIREFIVEINTEVENIIDSDEGGIHNNRIELFLENMFDSITKHVANILNVDQSIVLDMEAVILIKTIIINYIHKTFINEIAKLILSTRRTI